MKNWKELKNELFQDKDFRREYKKLEPEYKLARQIIKARLTKNLTQAELAKRAGVKQEYIARLESGAGNPTFASINKVISTLDKELKIVESKK